MNIEQICIVLFCILQVAITVIVMLLYLNRDKKWKFNPNEYRFVPDKDKKWNLNVMLQGMTDQGVLWIVAALYLFFIIMMEIVLIW